MTRSPVPQAAVASPSPRAVAPAVSPHEREADLAAEVVAAGGSVAGWSFSAVPPAPPGDPAGRPVGGGRTLDPRTRRFMEAGFGRSFADVRVHTDGAAARSAAWVDAHAYTKGRELVFANGRYDPDTSAGRRLLAHELAHVVQQRRSPSPAPIQRFTAYSSTEQTDGKSRGWKHPTGKDMRVSDDGQMAVTDRGWGAGRNKRAWTTPALVSTSNSILDAQGSHARLREKAGGVTISGSAPDGGAASTLKEIEPFRPGGGTFSLIDDCGHACRQILGSGPIGTRDVAVFRREARPGATGTGGAIALGILGGLVGGGLGSLLFKIPGPVGVVLGIIGLVGGAIGGAIGGARLGRRLAKSDPVGAHERYSSPQTYHAEPRSTPEDFSAELYQRELGGATAEEGLQRYAAMSRDEREEFDRRHGINRHARPRVGEGITIGTEYRMPGFVDLHPGDTWNFHYAAAVLDSGHDYVTLESAANWGPLRWIFYMYGPPSKKQTFHEEHLGTETHGTRATSLVVKPEFQLDVSTKGPDTPLRTATATITLPAGQTLRVLERRTPYGGSEEVRVKVVGGPNDGVEGWIPAGAI